MLFLEADDAFALFQNYVMPFTDATISLDLCDREIVLVAEADLVDPVLARLDTNLSNATRLVNNDRLVTLVHS